MNRPVRVVRNAGLSRPRITLTADEIRIKFPDATDEALIARAIDAAGALRDFLTESTVTLRGRFDAIGDGFYTTLATTNGRVAGKYRIDSDLTVSQK